MICKTPYYVEHNRENIPVNCGRCPSCKLRRIQQWVFRLKWELKSSHSAYFVTLTYNRDNLPKTDRGLPTLDRKHFQLFMKKLRRRQKSDIRYYMCGEYGGKSYRPHYHAIIFNVEGVKQIHRHMVTGYPVYRSEVLEECWTYGYIDIGSVTNDSMAYTAKYIDKEKRIPRFKGDDRIKEYSAMSKGIGSTYLKYAWWHLQDITRCYCYDGPQKIAMPKYYRDRIFTEEEKERQIIEIQHRQEEEKRKLVRQFNSYYARLNVDVKFEDWLRSSRDKSYYKFYKINSPCQRNLTLKQERSSTSTRKM